MSTAKLDPAVQKLIRNAASNAYAPFSRFRVGAILEDEAGNLYPGCNVECASIGLSICAERAALGLAITEGAQEFRRLWVYAPTPRPTPPCGGCREMLAHFAPRLEITLVCDGPGIRRFHLPQLLPGRRAPKEPGR